MSWFSKALGAVGHVAGEVLSNPIVDDGLSLAAGVVGGPLAAGLVGGLAGAIGGNQAKQAAKGQAGAAQASGDAGQAAADAKLKELHSEDIQMQSQAAGVARVRMGGTLDQGPATLFSPITPSRYNPLPMTPRNVHTLPPGASSGGMSPLTPTAPEFAAPTKVLLGQ